jgi:transposase InsO family protein
MTMRFRDPCARFKGELLEGGAFANSADVGTALLDYIKSYYNHKRLRSLQGYPTLPGYEN